MKQEKVIRINNIKLKPDHTEAELLKAVKKALRLKNNCDIKSDIIKRSIDARHKPDIMYVYSVDVKKLVINNKDTDLKAFAKKTANNNITYNEKYKINSFEFFRYEDVIKKEDDPTYDQKAFEKLLEIKGDSDHTKLIQMLTNLNDISQPIADILDQYFDRENLTYWMAYQILTGNVDTQNRNTYLYSPQNSDTWYLIAWDNDGSFMRTEYNIKNRSDQGSWECGVSNYWGNVLFQRCLQSEDFREELDAAIQDLRSYLSVDRISSMIEKYRTVTQKYLNQMPDQMYAPLTEAKYETIASAIPSEVEQNYELYKESLEKPMPFYIGKPVIEGNTLKLNWDASYDFDAETITYTVELAKDYKFNEIVFRQDNIQIPEAETTVPADGQYFVRIRATNQSGKTQDAFDYYVTDDGKNYGMKCFYITGGQNVEEDIYEE